MPARFVRPGFASLPTSVELPFSQAFRMRGIPLPRRAQWWLRTFQRASSISIRLASSSVMRP